MKILIVNHYAGSPQMGMEYRPYYLAKNWCEAGHKVVIICASYSHLRIDNPKVEAAVETQIIDGIHYVFIKTHSYSENNRKRTINIMEFLYGLYKNEVKIAKRLKPDVVIASSTYPFDAYFAIKIAKISGAAFVYEIHDIWPLSLEVLHGYSEKHPLIRAIHTAQKKAVKSADLVVSILAYADRYLKENGLFPKRYLHIPNGIDFEEVNITSNYLPLIQKYKQDGFFVLVYAGGFAQANALNELILSAKNVDDDVVYILIGDGSEKVKIKRLIDKNNIKNILLLDSIPKNEIKSVLTQADCLYIGAKKSILYEYGIGMNKLYDYMNSGKPVICGIQAADNPIEKAGCGIIIPAENSVVIAQAVQTLKAMTDEQRTEMGTKGKQYTKAYHDCNILAKNFATALEQLCDIRSIHW